MPENHRPRRVDFLNDKEDFECAYLGSLGFSTRYIMSQTTLRGGQISYRLKIAQIKRMDYRNGESPIARQVLSALRGTIRRSVMSLLKG